MPKNPSSGNKERWRKRLVNKVRNGFVNTFLFHGCERCVERFPFLPQRLGALSTPSFPVDVVYTWVDGNDEKLVAQKTLYLPPPDERTAEGQGTALFRDNQELRFSLRSLEAYAPWVRRIFIVTDGQKPDWLDVDHEKITLIDHKDIIPEAYLPTFNARVIDCHLHRIPDLAEHYICFNDDFFLSAPCRPEDFFTWNGLPYIFSDWRASRAEGYLNPKTPHAWSFNNARSYLAERGFDPAPFVIAAHVPYPQSRSNALAAYEFYRSAIEAFGKNRFRSNEEMAFHCHAAPLWAFAVKKAVPCDAPYYYVNVKRRDRQVYYQSLLKEKDNGFLPVFYCLNDVGASEDDGDWRRDMINFMTAFYPKTSAFEMGAFSS